MSRECEECGADGKTLLCICKEQVIESYRLPAESKGRHVIAIADGGPTVKCCQCGISQQLYARHDEHKRIVGKHMAGRASWCPSCGHNVFVPV